ncbi:HET-domain-containing protein [Apiospora phragmitis]|uniref:HET-domain-containing protein n=1 Tax=Apiospora phragmitis TaxID=2905665 RepID=A0ABR1T575_9PEZI
MDTPIGNWVSGDSIFRDVFISTEFRSYSNPVGRELQFIQSRHCPEASGFLFQTGFGNMDHIQAYIEVYDARSFTVTTLRQRRPRDTSHQLVSSGHFSVLFSAVWDADGTPVAFHHTIIREKASDVLMNTQNGNNWEIFNNHHT